MQFRVGVHSARAMHVRYAYAKAPLLSGNRLQNRSDFEPGLCFSIGRSMNEDFLWWVGEK